ncbi:UNVERIFIED_CONTAM: hypothetical protein K2H54_059759 [Gekko kuhli]
MERKRTALIQNYHVERCYLLSADVCTDLFEQRNGEAEECHVNWSKSKSNEESGDSQQPSQPSQQPSVQAAIPQTQLMLAGGQITGV